MTKKSIIVCDDSSRLADLEPHKKAIDSDSVELLLKKTVTEVASDELDRCIFLSWHISNCGNNFQAHRKEITEVRRIWRALPKLLCTMHSGGSFEETLSRGKELGIIDETFPLKKYDVDRSINRGLLHWYDVKKIYSQLSGEAFQNSALSVAELIRSLLHPSELGSQLLPLDLLVQGALLLHERGEEDKIIDGWYDVAEEPMAELVDGCSDIVAFENKNLRGLDPGKRKTVLNRLFDNGQPRELYRLAQLVAKGVDSREEIAEKASGKDFLKAAHKQYSILAEVLCAKTS